MNGLEMNNSVMRFRIILLAAVFGIAVAGCSGNEKVREEMQAKVDSLQKIVSQQQSEINSLHEIVNQANTANRWYNSQTDGRIFLKQNITDPASFIKESLRGRTDLIPLEPVLGGKMHFGDMQLLGSHWIIAKYEDGHVMGQSLYEYTLGPEGEVQFSILVSSRS